MNGKKKDAPLATNGTSGTSTACDINCDYDNTVSFDIQDDSYDLTYNGMLRAVTSEYLGGIDPDMPPSPAQVEAELLQATNNAIEYYNLGDRDPNAPANAKLRDAYPDAKAPDERVRKFRALVPCGRSLRSSSICTARSACAGWMISMTGISTSESIRPRATWKASTIRLRVRLSS